MKTSAIVLLASAASTYGHAVITAVIGANGVTTMGFGVTDTVLRTGTTEQPFQLDTPVLKNLKDDPCGATLQGGSIVIADAMKTALTQGGGSLPSFSADGTVEMTLHQVNADGGGPFTAMVNADATGATWVAANVVVQAPGANGILHGGPANVPFSAQIPAGTKCTGGSDGATCLVRINNGGTGNTLSLAQGAGPFGGCVAVTQSTAAVAANGTAAAATTAATGKKAAKKAALAAAVKAAAAAAAARTKSSRFFAPSVESREARVRTYRGIQLLQDISELVARGELTADLIDEIKTATGTAIDIPIDNLAGHDDSADLGGNSTVPTGAVLTDQQAVDLKKAVQNAIATALTILNSGGAVNAVNGQDLDATAKANSDADKALLDGTLTSINLGNAGVGTFQTAAVDALLGPLATVTLAAAGAKVTDLQAGTVVAAAASTTTAATRTGKGRKSGKNRQN